MNINIQFISVDVENKGKYSQAEVTYKDLGQNKVNSKKLMSFTNKEVYQTMVDAKKGETFTVGMTKNDKGYWDWVSVARADEEQGVTTNSSGVAKATVAPRSTYETPEERAQRQVYIVRQSSLSNAIEYMTGTGSIKKATADDVIFCAKQFEDYVFDRKAITKLADLPVVEDLGDDIPY